MAVTCAVILAGALLPRAVLAAAGAGSFAGIVAQVQPVVVKLYGAGGLRGLEAYQSGMLISAEGHVLTAWSYVLDTDYITVVLHDGRRLPGQLLGADPRLEIAVLKVDAADLPHVSLTEAVSVQAGARVLAFSNLYGVATGSEAASVQHGVVSAVTTLAARRGAFQTPYSGPVYVLDAMTNNAGAAGGLLTDRQGRPVGLLGKELRDAQQNTWLNYAMPLGELAEAVADIVAGKARPRGDVAQVRPPTEPLTLAQLGLMLVPDVLAKTPPFVDDVRPGSPAAQAGIRPDDLVVFVDDRRIGSCKSLVDELSMIDRIHPVRVMVLRDQQLLEFILRVTE
jgi:serine protease Do